MHVPLITELLVMLCDMGLEKAVWDMGNVCTCVFAPRLHIVSFLPGLQRLIFPHPLGHYVNDYGRMSTQNPTSCTNFALAAHADLC